MSDQQRIYTIKKAHILNEQERNCFDILTHSITHGMYILPKIQIKELFETPIDNQDDSFWEKFKSISKKHIDFLVCDRKDFKPLLAVIIQAGSEEEFLSSILSHAHIPLLTISLTEIDQYKRDFESYAMLTRIKEALQLE